MKNIRILICAALFCLNGLAYAAEFTGKVIAVLDGDTLLVMRGGHPVKVRLAEVDAPEKAQPYGIASQKSLAEMVMGKQIQVASRAVDDYGRMVATVSIDELNVNHEQVRRGMAWAATRWRQSRREPTGVPLAGENSRFHGNRELVALQREAQQARRGLWAGAGAVEPSQWRKQHPGSDTARRAPALNPSCDKKRCAEMSSCAEAKQYLALCGVRSLDADGDGLPCEKLCAPLQKN